MIETEPLARNNGVSAWKILKFNKIKSVESKVDLLSPFIFYGLFKSSLDRETFIRWQREQFQYHVNSNRVYSYGVIVDDSEGDGDGVNLHDANFRSTAHPYDDGCGDSPLDNVDDSERVYDFKGNEVGVFIAFNCDSNAEATEYMAQDPFFRDKLYSTMVRLTTLLVILNTTRVFLYCTKSYNFFSSN